MVSHSDTGGTDICLDSIANAWSNTVDSLDVSGKLEHIQTRASELTQHLIQLIVVFVFQTALIPIMFLWVFLQTLKWLFKPIHGQNPK